MLQHDASSSSNVSSSTDKLAQIINWKRCPVPCMLDGSLCCFRKWIAVLVNGWREERQELLKSQGERRRLSKTLATRSANHTLPLCHTNTHPASYTSMHMTINTVVYMSRLNGFTKWIKSLVSSLGQVLFLAADKSAIHAFAQWHSPSAMHKIVSVSKLSLVQIV